MSAADDDSGDSFRGLILQLRGRIGLTQRELAARLEVHPHSVQAWEAGTSYPGAASLRGLIAVALQAGGFTPGDELAEATALWSAAMRESSRLRTPFDRAWFDGLLNPARTPERPGMAVEAGSGAVADVRAFEPRRHSWGEAPDVAGFVGRTEACERLRRWVLDDRCRVAGLYGLAGIGKTLLAARLAHEVAPHFEYVYWRSLRDAPAPGEWLAAALAFLAPDDAPISGEAAQAMRLLELLSRSRCLLVLDNFETVLSAGAHDGGASAGHDGYTSLLRQLGEVPHQSCLLLTSREAPAQLEIMRGERSPVRSLHLAGFGVDDGQDLLTDKGLDGNPSDWQALVAGCGGNGLALKVTGETIRDLFCSSISSYLEFAASTPGLMIGGLRQVLAGQMERLSGPERHLLHWLAVEREPVSFVELAAELGPRAGRGAALEAIEGLRRRSLLERGERQARFILHPVVLEYVTEQLIEEIADEIGTGDLDRLLSQPLMKATARDYVRRGQERLIAGPILDQLVVTEGSTERVERRLLELLERLRGRRPGEQGYGPGNLVNLLRLLRGDLKGVDLSGLAIRQAYLQEVEAQDASLAGAHLVESVLAQAFSYPTHVALSADGVHLVAGTSTGGVYVWRVADRVLVTTLRGHAGLILGVALSADGRRAASSSYDGTVKLWEAESGQLLATLQGNASGTPGVALSEDGQLVASGGFDGTVRLWETRSGRLLVTLPGHTGAVWGVALSGDGRLIASGGEDKTVKLWEVEAGRLLASLEGHTGGILGVALSGDGRLIASGGEDETVRLWETVSGRLLAALSGHTGAVWDVALSGDGQFVASGSEDKAVRLWEAGSGRPLATLQGHTGGVRGVALSADGQLVASGSVDGTVKLWEAGSRQLVATFQGLTGGVRAAALSADGRLVASGGVDGTVKLWEAETGRLLATLQGHAGAVWGVALSEDGQLVASGSHDETVGLWETGSGRLLASLQGHPGGVRAVALSADGRLVASGSHDGTVRLWESDGGRLRTSLHGHVGEVHGVALSADGRLVASGGVDGTVKLWETETGRLMTSLDGHAGAVWSVALSRDGHLVASGSHDRTVRLWEAPSGRPLATLRGHAGAVWGVALSRDGRLVASGSEDKMVKLWDAESGQLLTSFEGHTGGILGVALSGDGQLVASGGVDGTVRLWDTSSGVSQRTLRAERRYERLDITGLTGLTDAQHDALLVLGAVDRAAGTP